MFKFQIFEKHQIRTNQSYKNKQLIRFDLDFKYSKIEDLNKLINSRLYTNVTTKSNYRKYKDFVEEMRYENDTIDNQVIVHLIGYKNKKKKKIIYKIRILILIKILIFLFTKIK